jgi:hypothetical protein
MNAVPQATLFDRPLPDPTRNIAGGLHRGAGDTERAAAELAAPRSGTWRWRVLLAVARAGASGRTDWELHGELGGLLYTVAPRRHELARDGWIEDSGQRRRTPSGTEAVVWRLSEAGAKELAEVDAVAYPEVKSIAEKRGEKILASLQELRNIREQVLAKLHGEKP